MRTAVYARKSTDNEAGIARQVELARDFATKKGWRVTDANVYTDNDVSGAIFKRKGLDALLAAVDAKTLDAVVMMEASRLGRDMGETLALQTRITKAGVRIFHYQDGQELLLATPVQKLQASIANYGAEDFRYQIKHKTRAALQQKAKAGHATGNRLFGYRSVPVGDHTERRVHEPEALIVRRIFKAYVDGRGTRGICKDLTAAGVPGPRGRGWRQASVRDLLRNPTYKGSVVFSKWENVDGGPRRLRPQSEWVTASVPQLRIVSDALWQAAQDRAADLNAVYLRTNGGQLQSKPVNSVESQYLLTGLAQCAVCHGPMGVAARVKKGERTVSLRCRRNSDRGATACSNGRMVPLARAEAAILTAFEGLLADEIITAHVYPSLTAPRAPGQREQQRAALAHALAEAERASGNLTEAIAAGGGAIPVLVAKLKEAERTRVTLAAQLAQTDAAAGQPDLTLEAFGRRVEEAAKGYLHLARQRPELVRAKLRKLLTAGRIVFHPADAQGRVRFEGEVSYAPLVADLKLPIFRQSLASGMGRSTRPTAGPSPRPGCGSPSSARPSS